MARYSTAHKAETRARILQAAERVMKERGIESATVEDVMREAGLTVGGFYAHFPSKEALAQESLIAGVERSFERLTAGLESLDDRAFVRALVRRYLQQVEDADLARACPMTLLLPEVARADDAFRVAFASRTAKLITAVAHRFPGADEAAKRAAAVATFAALAGAVAFARAAATPRARRRLTEATERLLADALHL